MDVLLGLTAVVAFFLVVALASQGIIKADEHDEQINPL
jgi:hypothetical protein